MSDAGTTSMFRQPARRSRFYVLTAQFVQLISVVSYILVALKFFLFGAVSVTVMLYGMSLLFGATGTLNLSEIARRLPSADPTVAVLGLALTPVGHGFKVAAAPFHVWVADPHQGAPTPITALLSVSPKAAGLAVLLRTLVVGVPPGEATWPVATAILAAATMTVGNLLALRQVNMSPDTP